MKFIKPTYFGFSKNADCIACLLIIVSQLTKSSFCQIKLCFFVHINLLIGSEKLGFKLFLWILYLTNKHFYLPKCMENDLVNAFMNKSSKKEVSLSPSCSNNPSFSVSASFRDSAIDCSTDSKNSFVYSSESPRYSSSIGSLFKIASVSPSNSSPNFSFFTSLISWSWGI